MESTIPENIKKPRNLADYLTEMLEEQKRKRDLNFDKTFASIRWKVHHIMGPLFKAWSRTGEVIADPSNIPSMGKLSQYV